MYKVFFNDREIIIAASLNITIIKPAKVINGFTSKAEVKSWFLLLAESREQRIYILVPSPAIFFKTIFKPAFKSILAAGGVVCRNEKLLFIFRNGKWDLPKGKIDKGEKTQNAAVREVREECGISGHKIVKQLPSTFHIYQSPYKESQGQWILKETFWFEMSYSGLENGIPQTEENISEIRWLAKNELGKVLENTYENLKQIIEGYLPEQEE